MDLRRPLALPSGFSFNHLFPLIRSQSPANPSPIYKKFYLHTWAFIPALKEWFSEDPRQKNDGKKMCVSIRRKVTQEIQRLNTWTFSSAASDWREYLLWSPSERLGKHPSQLPQFRNFLRRISLPQKRNVKTRKNSQWEARITNLRAIRGWGRTRVRTVWPWLGSTVGWSIHGPDTPKLLVQCPAGVHMSKPRNA